MLIKSQSGAVSKSQLHKKGKSPLEIASSSGALGIELTGLFPMTVQSTIYDESGSVWCTLRNDSLTIPAEDILLQHGTNIAGKWSLLGVLDARPKQETDNADDT